MPPVVNVHDTKTQLSRLLVRVSMGEEVIIARAGTPVARLVATESEPKRRTPGDAYAYQHIVLWR